MGFRVNLPGVTLLALMDGFLASLPRGVPPKAVWFGLCAGYGHEDPRNRCADVVNA